MLNLTRRPGEAILMQCRDQKALMVIVYVDHQKVGVSFNKPKTMTISDKGDIIVKGIGEKITIRWNGYKIVVKMMQMDSQVKIAFDAPKAVSIDREEIGARKLAERMHA